MIGGGETIRGTCWSMCPEEERVMREKEGLLHRFETYDEKEEKDEEKEEGGSRRSGAKATAATVDRTTRRVKADPRKTVKQFSRSAAGTIMTDPARLRPAPVLSSTMKYLLNEIATRTDVDWIVVYDFILDRCRSVRQDAAIQRIDVRSSIEILEPTVRFLVYSAQRLCDRSASEFDATINDRQLSECITSLLKLYDERDVERAAGERGKSSSGSKKDAKEEEEEEKEEEERKNREEMEAMYVLLRMGDVEGLRRVSTLPIELRRSMNLRLSTEISSAWYLRNYARVCSLIRRLPPILICAATMNIQDLRRRSLKIMSRAYNGKASTFSGWKLQELLLYRDAENLRADCETFGLERTVDGDVSFDRRSFKDEARTANPESYYSQRTLQDFLPRILLESAA